MQCKYQKENTLSWKPKRGVYISGNRFPVRLERLVVQDQLFLSLMRFYIQREESHGN